jgi:hypothetical protein
MAALTQSRFRRCLATLLPEMLHNWRHFGYSRFVPRERPLQVGEPQTFAELVSPMRHVLDEPLPDLHGHLEGIWLRLKGGPLPVPITVRIDSTRDGRYVITGLVIGLLESERSEITWETLRQIKLATVLEQLFEGWDRMNPAARARSRRGQALLELWELLGRGLPEVQLEERPRRHAAPDLRRVAEVYLKHLAATPHKATKKTADELHCSRATVIRRQAEARAAGLLPGKEPKK